MDAWNWTNRWQCTWNKTVINVGWNSDETRTKLGHTSNKIWTELGWTDVSQNSNESRTGWKMAERHNDLSLLLIMMQQPVTQHITSQQTRHCARNTRHYKSPRCLLRWRATMDARCNSQCCKSFGNSKTRSWKNNFIYFLLVWYCSWFCNLWTLSKLPLPPPKSLRVKERYR